MINQPDYDFFLKLDKWTKKDAALILSGLDPLPFKSVRFGQDDIPGELSQAFQLYRIFCSVNFTNKYGRENYPLDFIVECSRKKVVMPEALMKSARELFQALKKFEQVEKQVVLEAENAPVGVRERERNYLLKTIGVLAAMYQDTKLKLPDNRRSKMSISAVVEDVLQYVEDHDLPSTGLGKSNLHKKISEGVANIKETV